MSQSNRSVTKLGDQLQQPCIVFNFLSAQYCDSETRGAGAS